MAKISPKKNNALILKATILALLMISTSCRNPNRRILQNTSKLSIKNDSNQKKLQKPNILFTELLEQSDDHGGEILAGNTILEKNVINLVLDENFKGDVVTYLGEPDSKPVFLDENSALDDLSGGKKP